MKFTIMKGHRLFMLPVSNADTIVSLNLMICVEYLLCYNRVYRNDDKHNIVTQKRILRQI